MVKRTVQTHTVVAATVEFEYDEDTEEVVGEPTLLAIETTDGSELYSDAETGCYEVGLDTQDEIRDGWVFDVPMYVKEFAWTKADEHVVKYDCREPESPASA